MATGIRIRAAAAALALAGGVATGCGGDDEPSGEAEARAAAVEFAAAIEGGDYEAACGELTDDLASQLGGERCADAIAALGGEGGDVSVAITDVRVSGPKAVADFEARREGAPPRESSFHLVESRGDWLVSQLGD